MEFWKEFLEFYNPLHVTIFWSLFLSGTGLINVISLQNFKQSEKAF